jgi:hypothetical protein
MPGKLIRIGIVCIANRLLAVLWPANELPLIAVCVVNTFRVLENGLALKRKILSVSYSPDENIPARRSFLHDSF